MPRLRAGFRLFGIASCGVLAVDEGGAAVTVAIALLALLVGYGLRLREWIKDRRLEAYSNLAASVDVLATSRARTFSYSVQLGPSMRVMPEHLGPSQEKVDEALAASDEAMVQFRRAAQRASLLASKKTGKAQLVLTQFIATELAPLAPYGRHVAPSVSQVLESAADAVWNYLSVAVHDVRRGKIEVASDPGKVEEPPPNAGSTLPA